MMRQIHRQTLAIALGLQVMLAAGVLGTPASADGLVASVVTDALTGVALGGIDPVTYFTEPAPLPGKPDYEYDWRGAPWYFANAANRDIFIRSPEIYAPQFGGHAVMSLAGGYLSDGNPQIYLLVAQRLYLFYSTDTRDAFKTAPVPAIAAARANWSSFSTQLAANAAPDAPRAAPVTLTTAATAGGQ